MPIDNESLAKQLDRMEARLYELQAQGKDVVLDLARIGGTRRTLGIPEKEQPNAE